MSITMYGKAILPSSSGILSCVHWRGIPTTPTKMVMDDGDSSLHSIMEVLDSVYGGATTYSALMSKLNTITQGNGEAAKDYYEHVVQLRVKLQEFHHHVSARRPGVPCQECLLQWFVARVPGHGGTQVR